MSRGTLERPACVALLLVLAVVAVYLPVAGFDFINFDDPYYVICNLHVRDGLSWKEAIWAIGHSYAANWHPVTWISHMLDCQLYGMNASGHHVTNLILHSANSVLLFLFLRDLTRAFWRSAFVAALFALHPLRVESVAWVAERKDVLSAFFGLLCLWAYTAYAKDTGARRDRRLAYYLLSLGCLAMALMSKAMVVTWPCVMLLLDFWPLNRFQPLSAGSQPFSRPVLAAAKAVVLEKIPFFALAAAGSIITFFAAKSWGGVADLQQVPVGLRIANVAVSYVRYLGKIFWPSKLAVVYPYAREWPHVEIAGAALLLVSLTVLALWQAQRRPYLLVGWLWFLGTLVPVIGFVQAGSQSIADRFTYLPAIGIFIAAAWGAAEWLGTATLQRAMAGLAAGAVIVICTVLSQNQVLYWQNTDTLFSHALDVTTNNFVAYGNLGLYYAALREHEQAKSCYRAALKIQHGDRYSWNGLAMALINQGEYEQALQSCQAALQVDPRMAPAHGTMGLALSKLGRTNEALAHYTEALKLEPDLAETHYNLANLLAAEGQIDGAREHYATAVKLNPGSADVHNNLAYILAREGRLDEAASEFHSALTLEPQLWQAHYGLADVLKRQGATQEAVQQYRATLAYRPGLVDALNRLAWILAADPDPRIRQGTDAVRLAEQACQLTQYRQVGPLTTLAVAYAETGRFDEAIRFAEQAQNLCLVAGKAEPARRSQQLAELFRSGRSYHEAGSSVTRQ